MTKEYWLEEKKKENYRTVDLCVWKFAKSFFIKLGFSFYMSEPWQILENQRQDLRVLYRSRIARVKKSILCQER